MQYVTVAVASELEAERLKQDLTENPGSPLLTPRWGNAVHATLANQAVAPAPTTHGSDSGLTSLKAGPVERSEAADRVRIREAAVCAAQVYPGPVGELLSSELLSWEQFGYRLGSRTAIMQIVDQVMHEYAGLGTRAMPSAEQVSHDAQVHAA
jgi:hypothetical protein